jgi:hypothetical protein
MEAAAGANRQAVRQEASGFDRFDAAGAPESDSRPDRGADRPNRGQALPGLHEGDSNPSPAASARSAAGPSRARDRPIRAAAQAARGSAGENRREARPTRGAARGNLAASRASCDRLHSNCGAVEELRDASFANLAASLVPCGVSVGNVLAARRPDLAARRHRGEERRLCGTMNRPYGPERLRAYRSDRLAHGAGPPAEAARAPVVRRGRNGGVVNLEPGSKSTRVPQGRLTGRSPRPRRRGRQGGWRSPAGPRCRSPRRRRSGRWRCRASCRRG